MALRVVLFPFVSRTVGISGVYDVFLFLHHNFDALDSANGKPWFFGVKVKSSDCWAQPACKKETPNFSAEAKSEPRL